MCLLLACASALGQSGGASGNPASQNDNPFPDAPAPAQNSASRQKPRQQYPSTAAPGAPDLVPQTAAPTAPSAAAPANDGTDNPFPGEDPNAPIIPTGPNPGSAANSAGSASAAPADVPAPTVKDIDPNGDPVRTPDWNNVVSGNGSDPNSGDGFSSSRTGLSPVTGDDASNDPKRKQEAPEKTPAQILKEDLDVGSFYLDQHNWDAAQSRFEEAFRLNPEEPKAVWGLAQSEEHLQIYAKAREHYELFLSYGPDGREAREARKALKEMPGSGANGPH